MEPDKASFLLILRPGIDIIAPNGRPPFSLFLIEGAVKEACG